MDQLSELKMGLSVTAMARQGREVRSVELRRKGRSLEILRFEQAETWPALAKRAKVIDESGIRIRASHHPVVAGLDSVGVAFYRMTLPKVGLQETDAMIRMQAETRLPLGVDQMGLGWKTIDSSTSECVATVAAMRRNSPAVTEVVALEPDHIILEADALVQMWRWGCRQKAADAIIMSCCSRHTVVCCVRDHQLIHASVLDLGLSDMVQPDTVFEAMSPLNSGPMDQFIRDLKGVMQLYQEDLPDCPSVTLLSDGSDALEAIAEAVAKAGLAVNKALPDESVFGGHTALSAADLYTWRVPIGLALCALKENFAHYELFKDLCGKQEKRNTSTVRPIAAIVAAIVAVCIMTGALYAVDVMRHKKLTELTSAPEVAQFQKEKAYQNMVAKQRADVLELINVVTSKEHKGIILDKLTYKKGQPLKIDGRADKPPSWYSFDKAMTNTKGVSQPKRDNLVPDEKTKKVKFGMSFHYKTYTRKVTQ
jgi:hypothetical protein